VLVCSENKFDIELAETLASKLKLKVSVTKTVAQALNQLATGTSTALLIDCDARDSFETLSKSNVPSLYLPRIYGVLAPELGGRIGDLSKYPLIKSVLIRSAEKFDANGDDLESLSRLIVSNKTGLMDGVKSFFAKRDIEILKIDIKQSNQKQALLEQTKSLLETKGWDTKVVLPAMLAVDELIMNAVFGAPVDENGRPLYASLSRSTGFAVESRFAVEVQIGITESQIALMVLDKSATLKRETVYRSLAKAFQQNQYVENLGAQSSGLGLATILRSGASMYFSCRPGLQTEVAALYSKKSTYRAFKNQLRFISTEF
jgi:hypothetical protein